MKMTAGLTGNKIIYLAWAIVFIFSCGSFVLAQESNQPKVPEGMEAVTIGGSAQLIIPKGAKTRKVGAQIIVEGTKEYMSRRFEEMEARFAKLEATLDELSKELQSLRESLKSKDIQDEDQSSPPSAKTSSETLKP